MSNLPCRPDARNPEHDKHLHTTIALQVSNGCSGDALSSRTDDLPAEPAHYLTICGRGAQGRGWLSSQTHWEGMSTSAGTVTASSGQSTADDLPLANCISGNATISEAPSTGAPKSNRVSIVLGLAQCMPVLYVGSNNW